MVDALSEGGSKSRLKTAFVLAGGGSFGAIQVGMLHSLVAHAADRSDGRAPVGMVRGAAFVGTFAAVLAGKSSSRGVEWGPSNKTGATSELDSDRRNFAMDGNFGMGQFGHGVVHHGVSRVRTVRFNAGNARRRAGFHRRQLSPLRGKPLG
jgi:hypothetical protein